MKRRRIHEDDEENETRTGQTTCLLYMYVCAYLEINISISQKPHEGNQTVARKKRWEQK